MGVHGLWELLAPVGRRVSVETLAGRRLAIDASIWMVQFMKAMRDEKGEMVRNAHLLGFFRRICKLLYLRTKPVFIFDGGTPALKRRTVIARRRQRENAQSKLRKTAEKLLLNHLKAMKLKDLAEDIKNQRQNQKNDAKVKEGLRGQTTRMGDSSLEKSNAALLSSNQERLDEILAASIQAEEEGGLTRNASKFSAAVPSEEDGEEDDEEMILPEMHGEVDPAVLANLPPSMQHGLLLQTNKLDNDAKGKKVMSDQIEMMGINSENYGVVSRSCNQEKLDEMIAASIAAENDTDVTNASTSTASMVVEDDVDEEDDDDEEMILPAMYGEVDPAVLAALPPSMQLDLLVQIRERLMAENRQKYQKVKKDPEKFSELQIQSYLKTVAFRREIDQVQKAAAGRGVSGVQSSRIASEAHREFIFSSSFTGDKQVLASSRVERNGDKQQASKEHTSNFRNNVPSTNNASTTVERSGDKQQASKEYPSNFKNNIPSKRNVTGSTPEESTSAFDDSIETYLDDRGHRRVSRVRAMGIRMTRDLQRNLDLMKEIEQEKTNANKISNAGNMLNEISNDILRGSRSNKAVIETSCGDGGGSVDTGVWRSHPGQKKVVESSVGDNDLNERNEQFMLKLETPIEISIEDDGESKYFDGDDDLFASLVAGNPVAFSANDMLRRQSSGSDSDCDWEEGIVEGNRSSFPNDEEVKIKVPHMEGNNSDDSEVEWEEGVCGNTQNTSCLPGEYGKTISKGYIEEEASLQEAIRRSLEDIGDECRGAEFVDGENKMVEPVLLEKIGTQQNESSSDIVDGVKEMDTVRHFYSPAQAMHNVSERDPSGVKEGHVITQQVLLDTFDGDGGLSSFPNTLEENNAHSSDALSGDVTDCIDDHKNEIEMANPAALVESLTKNLIKESDAGKKGVDEKSHDDFFQESEHSWEKSSLKDDKDTLIEATEANLEEEMRILGQECMDLGDERRRLERNVESVSSEMFTECQALLQMFGIPYIIAPMEAEAQCAYMELANLVDGVVTDDSDVFLFGGRSVYKNIFDDRKYVETYFMKDVENELGLSREKLIRMALLLGSDYTEGVSGIGIVNAIEVLNAFPEEDGLQKFRDWIESPDPTILGKPDGETGSIARKKGSNDINTKSNTEEVSSDLLQEMKETFMDKHRKVSKNWHIPPSFPSEAVSSAYTCPQVDKSTEPFTWGKPDHFVLRKLCWEKFGWGNQKADELLIPVLKEYDKRETQLRLEAFYTFNERFAKIRSKRIKKAVKGITGNQSSELMDEAAQEVSRSRKKRSVSTDEAGDDKSEKLSDGTNKSVLRNQSNSKGKSTTKQSRKRKTTKEPVPSEQPKPAEARQTTNRRLHANRKGRGRGRRSVPERGKGKEKENPNAEVSETSSSNGDGDNDGMDFHMETIEGSGEVRRSGRLRKPVNYTVNLEIDDVDEPLDHSDTKCSNEEAGDQVLSWDESILEDGTSGLSEKKHQNAGNLSPKAGLGKDYLDTGGGFCPVEDETGELGSSQHGEPSLRADVSEGYLKLGGRFCRGDGEVGDDQDQDGIPFQPTATASENSNHPSTFADEADLGCISVQPSLGTESSLVGFQGCGRTDAYDDEQSVNHGITTNNDDHSKLSGSLMDNSVDNPGHPSVGGLTAMPFLRKKRRKT